VQLHIGESHANNIEIPGLRLTAHPGMTIVSGNPQKTK